MAIHSNRRSVLRAALAVILGIITIIVMLSVLLTLRPGEAFLRGYLERRLAAEFDQQVSIGGLETNLLSRFQITDLSIHRIKDGTEVPSLKVGSVLASYTLRDIVNRHLTIRSVSVESLSVAVKRDSSGSYNFPFLNTGQAADSLPKRSGGFGVTLGSASLTAGEVIFEDRSALNLNAVGRGIAVGVRGTGDAAYAFEAAVDSGRIRYTDISVHFTDIELKGRWDGQWVSIDSLGLRLPGMELAGRLGLRPVGGPGSLEGRITVRGDPGPLARDILEAVADTTLAVGGNLDLTAILGGSIDGPVADLDVGMTDLAVEDFLVPHLRIKAAARPESIRLDALTLETLGGKVNVRGSVRMDSLLSFQSVVRIDGIAVRHVLELARPDTLFHEGVVGGALAASGGIRVPLGAEVTGDLSVTHLEYRGKPVPDIAVGISFRGGNADLVVEQGSSIITVQAAVRRERLDGRFAVHIPELAPLAGLFVPDLSGRVDARGRLGGSPESPSADVDIDSIRVVYRNFPLDDLRGRLRYSAGEVYLTGLAFRGGPATVDTLNPPFGLAGLTGGFGYEGFVEGPAESLTGWVRGQLSRSWYKNFGIDTLALAARIERGEVSIETLDLRRDSLVVYASGQYSIPGSSGEFQVTLHDIHVPEESTGTVERTDTPLSDGIVGRSRQIGSMNFAFDLSDRESIWVRIYGRGIEVGPLAASFAGAPARGRLSFSADIGGPLTQPDVRTEFFLGKPGFESVDFDSVTGRVVVAGAELRVERLDAYYGPARNHVTALLGLDMAPGGGYTITERSRFAGSAAADRLDLGLVNPLLPEGMQVQGHLSYDLEWDGTLRAPHPRGRLAVRGASLMTGEAIPAVSSVGMDIFLEDSLISVDKLAGVVRDTPFELGATLVTSGWRDFDMDMRLSLAAYGEVTGRGRISGEALDFEAIAERVNLDVLAALSPSIERMEGILDARIGVTGTAAAPRIRGGLRIRDLTVESPEFSPALVGGVAVVDFQDNRVRIDSVFVKLGKGHMFVTGRLTFAGRNLTEVGIDIEMRNLEFERPGVARVSVQSGDLKYSGTTGPYLLDGDIVMGDTRFIMNFDPRSILPFAGSVRKPQQELPSLLANTSLDVRLRDSKDLWVDNNVARIRSHAELNVLGALSQPTVTGRVAIEEGYVMFLDRKFEIGTGTVDFVERDRLNPIIELHAQSKVKTYRALKSESYEVYLDVTGPLDEVKVALTSDPLLDRANILSLLTLGVTREELVGGGSEGEGTGAGEAFIARAEELTTRVVSGFVSRNVADLIGLKEFSIEGNLFRRDEDRGPRLVASRGLSERVDVTYSTNIGDFNENRVRMDYRLSERFLLQGETDQQGKAAIDLKYRVRFR